MSMGGGPLGGFGFGFGMPSQSTVPPGTPLRDEQGRQTGSRKINERTRTYEFDANGRVLGMNDTRQLVLLAIATAKGSCVQADLGHDLATIEDIGPDFQRRVDNALRGALASLVVERRVEILDVAVDLLNTPGTRNARGASVRLRWRDLTDPAHPTYEERA